MHFLKNNNNTAMPDNNVASNQKYSLKIKKSFAKLFTAAQAFDDFFPLFFGAMTPGMVSSIPTRIRYGFPDSSRQHSRTFETKSRTLRNASSMNCQIKNWQSRVLVPKNFYWCSFCVIFSNTFQLTRRLSSWLQWFLVWFQEDRCPASKFSSIAETKLRGLHAIFPDASF